MAGPVHTAVALLLTARDDDDTTLSPTDQFLKLIQNPFKESMQLNAFWVSLGTSLGFSLVLALLFSLFRPYHNAIYAPKVKHADQKHAPPKVGKGIFAWVSPVLRLHKEEESLADRIGLDAVVFLRCAKMMRNIFLVLAIIGCGTLIAVNLTESTGTNAQSANTFTLMTPMYIKANAVWAQVVCAYAFDFVILFFLWHNYKAILALRRRYFQSPEYQMSLHARTLMITSVPPNLRSEEGLMRLTDAVNPTSSLPRTTIGRNVKDLPSLIKKHEEAVRELESVLAKYLKNPDRLPINRPTMRPPRKHRDGSGKVDAIDYLTDRIQELEARIKDVRQSVDKRNPMPYGFASWEAIEHAHVVAYTARKKTPQGTVIRLAPRPHDIIWENLHLSPQMRRWRRMVNVFWVTLLTFLWIAPNAMIAIFLTDLSNLGLVWPAFQTSLEAHPETWAAVQGVASPALTSLVYLILPIFFRRLMRRAGDITKTSRERHVIHYLYFFFVFNNLIVFSLFSAAWTYVAAVINAKNNNESAWQAIEDGQFWYKAMSAMCQVSPFWVSWLLQRNLGATLDLVQLFTIVWKWFMKTFMAPTPRQSIEWTAPPPFDYASYYNYYLFYATVAFCFATLQPIILPVAALYFLFDCWFKRYLLLYVFVTKNESGGRFWTIVLNRMLFGALLANLVIALVAKANGTWTMIFCMVPLPFILLGFRLYTVRAFDDDMIYYNRATLNDAEALGANMGGKGPKRAGDRLNSRFGHPALYKPLVTPMVHARAGEVLKSIYRGRLGQLDTAGDYSDIAMQSMSTSAPGKPRDNAPFEVVAENQLDFSYFKNRADFRDEFGGGIYGRAEDLISERSHTPRTFVSDSPDSSRASSPVSLTRKQTEGHDLGMGLPMGMVRPNDGDHPAFRPPMSRVPSGMTGLEPTTSLYRHDNESESRLLSHAEMPAVPPVPPLPADSNNYTINQWRTRGYGPVAQDDSQAPTSYDYFRGKR